MIFGKRYRKKSIADILEIIKRSENIINAGTRCTFSYIVNDIATLKNTYRRVAYYGNDGKIAISLNKVKEK